MSKKRVLILGSSGMAGSMIYTYFQTLNKYTLFDTARIHVTPYTELIDVEKDPTKLINYIIKTDADVVINCIGVLVKASEENPERARRINSELPHFLAYQTRNMKTKIVHLGTDCVFDGKNGPYSADSLKDEVHPYGYSKGKGELINDKDLTIRMSIIGPELKKDGTGLFDWFMRQKGLVNGYTNVWWNGITTLCLAQNIEKMISYPIAGLYQLAPDYKTTKYHLLQNIASIFNKYDVRLVQNGEQIQDKTLLPSQSTYFTPYMPSFYNIMLQELKDFMEKK